MAEETETTNFTGIKVLSKLSMVLAGIWILAGTILKGFNVLSGLSVWEIILSGLGLVVVWAPGYASIYIDKIKELKGLAE